MLAFTGYVIAVVSFSKELPCSCGGVLQEMSWGQHIVFNIVFTLLALVAALLERKQRQVKAISDTTKPFSSYGSASLK
jgi:hypothetical protein